MKIVWEHEILVLASLLMSSICWDLGKLLGAKEHKALWVRWVQWPSEPTSIMS